MAKKTGKKVGRRPKSMPRGGVMFGPIEDPQRKADRLSAGQLIGPVLRGGRKAAVSRIRAARAAAKAERAAAKKAKREAAKACAADLKKARMELRAAKKAEAAAKKAAKKAGGRKKSSKSGSAPKRKKAAPKRKATTKRTKKTVRKTAKKGVRKATKKGGKRKASSKKKSGSKKRSRRGSILGNDKVRGHASIGKSCSHCGGPHSRSEHWSHARQIGVRPVRRTYRGKKVAGNYIKKRQGFLGFLAGG